MPGQGGEEVAMRVVNYIEETPAGAEDTYHVLGQYHGKPEIDVAFVDAVPPRAVSLDPFDDVFGAQQVFARARRDFDQVARRIELGLHHEQQHQELLLTDLQQRGEERARPEGAGRLEEEEGEPFGLNLVMRGARERLPDRRDRPADRRDRPPTRCSRPSPRSPRTR